MPLHVKGCESRPYRFWNRKRTYPGCTGFGGVGPDRSLSYLQVYHALSESHPPPPLLERDLCRPGLDHPQLASPGRQCHCSESETSGRGLICTYAADEQRSHRQSVYD